MHFTILRPPEKQDGTPINELSLIAFPTRELFQQKINEFQLIIFDRYARQGVLPIIYFDNIARYVRDGGAVLVAAGPDYASPTSIWRTPLDVILPAEPSGRITDGPFHAAADRPRQAPSGDARARRRRRAIRRTGAAGSAWSMPRAAKGTTVMQGPDNKPLLLLSREGEGRVALLLSDHIWLWARGYRGRRAAYRSAAAAVALADEAARPRGRGAAHVRARPRPHRAAPDHGGQVSEVTLTTPSGKTRTLTLTPAEPGVWRSTIEANELGLWRATDGKLNALANVGPANPREFTEVTSTTEVLAPLANATGGDVRARRGRRAACICRASSRCARATPTRATTGSGLKMRERQRGARHRRAAGVRRADRAAAAGRQPRRDVGARGALSRLRWRAKAG